MNARSFANKSKKLHLKFSTSCSTSCAIGVSSKTSIYSATMHLKTQFYHDKHYWQLFSNHYKHFWCITQWKTYHISTPHALSSKTFLDQIRNLCAIVVRLTVGHVIVISSSHASSNIFIKGGPLHWEWYCE